MRAQGGGAFGVLDDDVSPSGAGYLGMSSL